MRRTTLFGFTSAALCALGTPSFAALPESAPVVTVGADIEQLQFDWEQVPRSNTYELWFKANDQAPWIKYTQMSSREGSRFRITVSAHLLDWRVAKYRVAACNPGGCLSSDEIGVADLAQDAIGYLKPVSNAATNHWYGYAVALSADGLTLAVLTGEQVGLAHDTAVVNVYRRPVRGGQWKREARFAPSTLQSGTAQPYFGKPLALSGDGNLLALGLGFEDAVGPNLPDDTGAVYLFRRQGTTWHQEQRLLGNVVSDNHFGVDVDLDDAGTVLAVARDRDVDTSRYVNGTVDVYRPGSSGWQKERTLSVPTTSTYPACAGNSLSGDGQTLVRTCFVAGGAIARIVVLGDARRGSSRRRAQPSSVAPALSTSSTEPAGPATLAT